MTINPTPKPVASKDDPDLLFHYLRMDFKTETVFLRFTDATYRDETASLYRAGENPPIIKYDPPPEELNDRWELATEEEGVWIIKYPNLSLNNPR
jgi:hypothetical protein